MSIPAIDFQLTINAITALINSSFVSAFLSALAGAGLGMWGAQRLAERSIKRDGLRDALSRANALIILAGTICNDVLELKQQTIKPLHDNYFEQRKLAESANDALLKGLASNPVRLNLKVSPISPVSLPIEALKQLTYSPRPVEGNVLATASALEHAYAHLCHAARTHAEQIDLLKKSNVPNELLVQNYFGLNRQDGRTESALHDSIQSLMAYTDHVLFFANELTTVLGPYAKSTQEKLRKLTDDVEGVNTADFSECVRLGQIPPRENYSGWLSRMKRDDE